VLTTSNFNTRQGTIQKNKNKKEDQLLAITPETASTPGVDAVYSQRKYNKRPWHQQE